MSLVEDEGFWGKQTATIDWCEANYEVTRYIAEFWNTISNIVMIVFPIYSLFWTYNHIQFAKKNKRLTPFGNNHFSIPTSVILVQISLILVGIGSWMFHMTLLYHMQLLDELPMIYGTAIQVYANYDLILAINAHEEKTSKTNGKKKSLPTRLYETRAFIFFLLALYCVVATFVYLMLWNNPIFHEFTYGLLAVIVIVQSFLLINRLNSDRRVYFTGLFYYVLGFTFWNIDNNFCANLNTYQTSIENFFGLAETNTYKAVFFNSLVVVLKSVFEFHSLWHVFTGYASYMAIIFLTDLYYRFYLKKINQAGYYEEKKPIALKYSMYYHLTNNLMKKSLSKDK